MRKTTVACGQLFFGVLRTLCRSVDGRDASMHHGVPVV